MDEIDNAGEAILLKGKPFALMPRAATKHRSYVVAPKTAEYRTDRSGK